ncbi:hypothetical protein INR76_10925 [Marixanthomonas sp. SCSIO 43207]|uniref:hypothetical protein n=1 Tax=Marixanthomonas sp. SCSIO 43207 TaxID=2779360 RepID=UPI001CA89969|nr:hypothetical protein [Marixanthomonas sp. SCSIO 43207]UAB80624.1 hypothetical protein INR76_10925 [Marixanthomonas sp. SCSIO 43207]
MKNTKLSILLVTLLCLVQIIPINAQETPDLGIMPIYKFTNNQVLFVDGTAGELKSFAVLDQPVMAVAVNKETGMSYAASRHSVYKIETESGEVVDSYQFFDILEKGPEDLTDPNMMIIPRGITNKGQVIVMHNDAFRNLQKKQQELTSKMKNASTNEIMELSKQLSEISPKLAEAGKKQTYYLIDFSTKSKRIFNEYDITKERFLALRNNGTFILHDKSKQSIKFIDVNTNEVIKEVSSSILYDQFPELRKYSRNATVRLLSDNLLLYNFIGNGEGVRFLYNLENNEILFSESYEGITNIGYPLYYENTSEYLFGEKDCSVGPMPDAPDFGSPAGTSKKKMAEWQEQMTKKQNEWQKAMKEWQDASSDPDNCDLKLYSDINKENLVMKIPKASFASIYNNNFALINRMYELVLYNVETQEPVWTIDIDF